MRATGGRSSHSGSARRGQINLRPATRENSERHGQVPGCHIYDGRLSLRRRHPDQPRLASARGRYTFDVSGFRHMLNRLKQNDETEVVVPVFDRKLEISRSAARTIRTTSMSGCQGNYILLRREPWSSCAAFDVTVDIRVPEEVSASASMPAGKAMEFRGRTFRRRSRPATYPMAFSSSLKASSRISSQDIGHRDQFPEDHPKGSAR